jgi:hypothetical protein
VRRGGCRPCASSFPVATRIGDAAVWREVLKQRVCHAVEGVRAFGRRFERDEMPARDDESRRDRADASRDPVNRRRTQFLGAFRPRTRGAWKGRSGHASDETRSRRDADVRPELPKSRYRVLDRACRSPRPALRPAAAGINTRGPGAQLRSLTLLAAVRVANDCDYWNALASAPELGRQRVVSGRRAAASGSFTCG